MTKTTEQIRALRESGHVLRCHTLPHHGEYSVAAHCWQACMLLLSLNPEPSKDLIQAVLFHDSAERYYGDVPTPVKEADGKLALMFGIAEDKALEALGVRFDLDAYEHLWLTCVDKLELYLWCEDQAALGNKHTANALNYVRAWFVKRWDKLPETLKNFINEFNWQRGADLPPESS